MIDRHSDMGRVALLRRHLYNFHNPLLGLISTTRLLAVATTQIYFYFDCLSTTFTENMFLSLRP